MTNEERINQKLTEIFEGLERTLPLRNGEAIREVERVRLTVSDVLSKYTQSDGTIPQNQINAVLTEITAIEGEMYRYLRDYIRRYANTTAEESAVSLIEIIIAIIGVKALLDLAGIPSDLFSGVSEGVEGLASMLFSAMTGLSVVYFARSISDSVFNRTGEDGLVLNDRIRNLSTSFRVEISETIRQSIRRRERTSEITRKIERKLKESAWRIKTIIETELLYAHRHTVAKFAELSGIASGLKIVDYPHGEPGEHARHKCHIYAHANEHGMGQGVYPVTTRKIRNPHPRCRSTLHLVLADSLN